MINIPQYKPNNIIEKYSSGKTDLELNKTLKGVLVNNHIRNDEKFSFDDIKNTLLISNSSSYYGEKQADSTLQKDKESSFNDKKALKPLLIGTSILLGGCFGLSAIFKSASKTLLNSKSYEKLPDLAVNNNIKQETQFAIYRVIREPSFRNILGAAAVFVMSGITIAAKNFVDGTKDIWLKKKSADIEKDFQENLISVETNAFSGKLKIVNDMLSHNVEYFDKVLNRTNKPNQNPDIFGSFVSFKGAAEHIEPQDKDKKNKDNIKNMKYLLLTLSVAAAALILGKMSISNIKSAAKNADNLANNIASNTIDLINQKAEHPQNDDLPDIIKYLKSICAKPEYIQEIGEKYHLTQDKINSITEAVEKDKKRIFADAPSALGGIPQKLQYYCYLDENRGHLYNWIINPDNKFTKYIFLAFTLSSAVGYLFNKGIEALRDYTVMRENAKTELDLRKRLVDVEIQNYKSKKESAVKPLIGDFTLKANSGKKSKEELKQLADNILFETKNGPPYIYT